MLRRCLCVVLATAFPLGSFSAATPATTPGLAGVYRCEGTNPNGTPYQGIVEIAPLDDTFLVQWTLADDVSVVGVGIYSGGVLGVSYFGGAPAIVVYKIDGDRLVGEWTVGAAGTVHSETLTRMAKTEPAPARRPPARTVRNL